MLIHRPGKWGPLVRFWVESIRYRAIGQFGSLLFWIECGFGYGPFRYRCNSFYVLCMVRLGMVWSTSDRIFRINSGYIFLLLFRSIRFGSIRISYHIGSSQFGSVQVSVLIIFGFQVRVNFRSSFSVKICIISDYRKTVLVQQLGIVIELYITLIVTLSKTRNKRGKA